MDECSGAKDYKLILKL